MDHTSGILRAIRVMMPFLIVLVSYQCAHAQMPRPLFGIKYDMNSMATYGGFDSTVYRQGFYAPGSFSFAGNCPRKRSRLGLTMLAPVAQIALWGVPDVEDSTRFLWSHERIGTGPGYDGTAFGLGLDLQAALTYDRANRNTYAAFDETAIADYSFEEKHHIGQGDPLKYKVWLNYDYLELSSCARLNIWWFHGNMLDGKRHDTEPGRNKQGKKGKGSAKNKGSRKGKPWHASAFDFLFEPIQLHLDYGFAVAIPVSKYGVYYKSNDPTPGIDEQVTQNMNDALQPTPVISRIMGIGLRAGRIDITYRWRLGKTDALRTLGNTYGFREWDNKVIGTGKKNSAIQEVEIAVYLFGGGPRAKK